MSPRTPPPGRRLPGGRVAALGSIPALVVGLAVLLTLCLVPLAVMATQTARAIDEQVLDFPPLPDDVDALAYRSVVVDRRGEELAVLGAENRIPVAFDELPDHLVDAVVATEDSQFFEHHGINWRGLGRAAIGNLRAGEITGGGSGITQQLVKNVVVGPERSYRRKLQEAWYAAELERRWSKERILATYLSEVYLANNTYGVSAAAEYYFGKDVGELTVAESALLAGVIRHPEGNDPVDHPEAALARRDVVLEQMTRQGHLTPAEADDAAAKPLGLDLHPVPAPPLPFFAAYVRSVLEAEAALGATVDERRRAYERGGLTITTTLDTRLQRTAERILADRLAGRPVTDSAETALGAITAVDPRTGEILTVAAGPREFGNGEGQTEVNPAVPGGGGSGRQAGSAFKAFQLVAALESGIPPSHRTDTPSPYEPSRACADTAWTPANYSDSGGGVLDMAEATARSSNVYFAELVDRTGPEKLAEVARRMGISSPLTANCSLVLGTAEVFPLEMAAAFGTLAADGISCRPYAVAEIRDRDGRLLAQGSGDCRRAVDEEVARRATDLLRGPLETGTARRGALGRPAAGKTGTTQSHTNAWFVGYVPQLSVAAWIGPEKPAPMRHPDCGGPVTGGCMPTSMWRAFVRSAISTLDLAPDDFPAAPDVPTRSVPQVIGRDADRARTELERAGFAVDVVEVEDWREPGSVVGAEPVPPAALPRGSLVTLRVSDGEGPVPTVPDVVGTDVAGAQRRLEAAGLRVRIEAVDADADRGTHDTVATQEPAAGEPAVSRLGRRPVTVRLVVGPEEAERGSPTSPARSDLS